MSSSSAAAAADEAHKGGGVPSSASSEDTSAYDNNTFEVYYCQEKQREYYYNPASDTVQWYAPNVSLLGRMLHVAGNKSSSSADDDDVDVDNHHILNGNGFHSPSAAKEEDEVVVVVDDNNEKGSGVRWLLVLFVLAAVFVAAQIYEFWGLVDNEANFKEHEVPAEVQQRHHQLTPITSPKTGAEPIVPVQSKQDDDTKYSSSTTSETDNMENEEIIDMDQEEEEEEVREPTTTTQSIPSPPESTRHYQHAEHADIDEHDVALLHETVVQSSSEHIPAIPQCGLNNDNAWELKMFLPEKWSKILGGGNCADVPPYNVQDFTSTLLKQIETEAHEHGFELDTTTQQTQHQERKQQPEDGEDK